jgi:class 3 adenylate cyclase
MPVEIPYLIHSLCGALILLIFHGWLRRKAVENTGLVWISISLLSWSAARAISLACGQIGLHCTPDSLLYLFSPVSSILFTMTAFRLVRVRDVLQTPDLRAWPKISVITVTLLSVAASILRIAGETQSGQYLDAFASSIALALLGCGLAYSFYSYGHRFLVWVTVMTFLGCIARQYNMAFFGSPKTALIISLHLANSTLMIMLFIALAVAWGFSDASRLRVTGATAHVNIVTLCVDLRGSTQWANAVVERDFHYVKTFIDDFIKWTLTHASESPLGTPTLAKFLGDGCLLIWEIPEAAMVDSINAGVRLGYTLHKHYAPWIKRNAKKFTWGVPVGIGIGVDVGTAIRLTFENGSNDYIGNPVSFAPKMQEHARPHGGVVIQERVCGLINGFRSRFTRQGVLRLGANEVGIRITPDH